MGAWSGSKTGGGGGEGAGSGGSMCARAGTEGNMSLLCSFHAYVEPAQGTAGNAEGS